MAWNQTKINEELLKRKIDEHENLKNSPRILEGSPESTSTPW